MIQVKIKNLSNVQTHGADFATQELADAWISAQKAKGVRCAWGRPAWTETHDENGDELETPIEHPDQFTVEISDLGDTPKFEALRFKRNQRLADCDWTQMADSPLSVEIKGSWATYRQQLRDLPANTQDPDNPNWPEEP